MGAIVTGKKGQKIYVMVYGARYPDHSTYVSINGLSYSLKTLGCEDLEPDYVPAVIFGETCDDYLHLDPKLNHKEESERIARELAKDESLPDKQPRSMPRWMKEEELEVAEWTRYGERIR